MSTYLDCVYPEPALDVLQDKLAAAYAAYIQHTIAAEVEVEDTDPYSDEAFEQEQNI